MIAKNIKSKNLIRKHRACSLEVITEEKDLESETTTLEGTRGDAVKKFGNSFIPFQSSWKNISQNRTRILQTAEFASKGNLKQQFESLKRNYDELLEKTRKQDIENQKKIKQMEADYEFMIERKCQLFKKREEELVQQIEQYMSNNMNIKETERNHLQLSITDTFEYEEISEKLKSLERENDLLQRIQHSMKTENMKIQNEFTKLKKLYASLELKYIRLNQRQPKWLNVQLGSNISAGKEIKIQNCLEKNEIESKNLLEKEKNIFFELEKLIEKKICMKKYLKEEEIKKIIKLFNTIKLRYNENYNDTLNQMDASVCSEEMKLEDNFHNLFNLFLDSVKNLLKRILKDCNNANSIESSKSHLDFQKNERKKWNTINLSDAEKLNENIFLEYESNVSNNNTFSTKFFIKKLVSDNITDNNLNGENDSLSPNEQNKNLMKEIERLQKENDTIKFNFKKLCDNIQEKDAHLLEIEKEKIFIDKDRKYLIQCTNYIQSLINNKRYHLEELTNLLLNENIEFQNRENDELGKKGISLNENLSPNIESLRKDDEMLNDRMPAIKSMIMNLKKENDNLKKKFAKIETHMEELKKDFLKCRNTCHSFILQKSQAVKLDISKIQKILVTIIRDIWDKTYLRQILPQNPEENSSSHQLGTTNDESGKIPDETFQIEQDPEHPMSINLVNQKKQSKRIAYEVEKTEFERLEANIHYSERSSIKTTKMKNFENQDLYNRIKYQANMIADSDSLLPKQKIIERLHCPGRNSEYQEEKTILNERHRLIVDNIGETNRVQINSNQKNANIRVESKKENRWKVSRTREYDSRRNIDMNKLCSESAN